MTFIDDQHVVQTFLSDAADPALGIGIGIRRSIGCQNGFYPLRGKYDIKGRGELAIAVMHEKAHDAPFLQQVPHELSGLLRDPLSRWPRGAAGKMNPAGADLDEKEHV